MVDHADDSADGAFVGFVQFFGQVAFQIAALYGEFEPNLSLGNLGFGI